MKTAVSIPDDVFRAAERLAELRKISRSRLYSMALQEYLARHEPDEITAAVNRVVEEVGDQVDPFVAAVAAARLRAVEW